MRGKQALFAAFAFNPPFSQKMVPMVGYAGEALPYATDS
jgi:hypothetical protein